MTTTRAPVEEVGPFWAQPVEDVLRSLGTTTQGLSAHEVERRRETYGPNRLLPPRRGGWAAVLARQFTDPIILILLGASGLSIALRDVIDAVIILLIVVASGLLSFWQEHQAGLAVQRLLALVRVHTDVRRDGRQIEVPFDDVVPGDIIVLNAGDVVPCDCRVLSSQDLQIDQAPLTGETFPRHKHPDPSAADAELADRHSALFLGSHVVSGRGETVAVATGPRTELGHLSARLEESVPRTGFEQGIHRFGLLLARVTALLATAIFVVNLVLGRPFAEALLFSLALAVGLTPQMLPAIVSVSLSTGARRMAASRVIVRRLDAIEDFGAMDVLCTDKTGTLTEGLVRVHEAIDTSGKASDEVGALVAANAGLQSGFTNPIDAAVLERFALDPAVRAIDEVPFDFTRKLLSVLVEDDAGRRLVTKGAYRSVMSACTTALLDGRSVPLEQVTADLDARFTTLGNEGYRVLAVAVRALPATDTVTKEDERDMTFAGFLVLADPPKAKVERALSDLAATGIGVRMITGDNRLAAAHIAHATGIDTTGLLVGTDIDAMDEPHLVHAVQNVNVFAEVDPLQKERIISALREGGSIVGYLGDGINDAGALHLADVGISVDTAVDVAKSAAAIVLLEKDLGVIAQGVRLGRQTFANTLKYVFTTVSANFGNMASMAAASAFLPFLPLLPRQILLLNFLTDVPSTTIAVDTVDPEQRESPQRWDLRFIRDFMIVFGLLSSAFDLLTFAILLQVFHAHASLFRSGWFVGSTLTELAVLLVLRTRRPAFRSRPGNGLLVTSVAVAIIVVILPFTGQLAVWLGLVRLRSGVLVALVLITLGYVASAEAIKHRFYRAFERQKRERARRLHPPRLARAIHEHGGPRHH
ncbi:MAG: magnesium-translocating P-type ATPase [Actinomycetota bacterium]